MKKLLMSWRRCVIKEVNDRFLSFDGGSYSFVFPQKLEHATSWYPSSHGSSPVPGSFHSKESGNGGPSNIAGLPMKFKWI